MGLFACLAKVSARNAQTFHFTIPKKYGKVYLLMEEVLEQTSENKVKLDRPVRAVASSKNLRSAGLFISSLCLVPTQNEN
jgi:hypothetical protein